MSTEEALKYANLKPAFFVQLDLADPKPVLSNKSLSEVIVMVEGGYSKTLSPKYPFDLTIDFGWDTLTTQTASPETTALDCHLYAKTKDGKNVHITYTGVVVASEKQVDVITNKSKGHAFEESYVTMHPTVRVDEGVEAESWITKKNLLGRGRFTRNSEGKLGIDYYVYVLE